MAEMHFAHLSSPDMQAMRYRLKVDIKYIDGLLRNPVATCSWRRGLDSLPRFQLLGNDSLLREDCGLVKPYIQRLFNSGG